MKEEKTYIVVDNVAEEEAKKFWKQIDNLQERIDKALKCINAYKELVGKPQAGITANLIHNLEYILKGHNETN